MFKVIKFFDKLEDRIRGNLSRVPIIYTLIGGVGVVLFWRGVWYIADDIPFFTGPVSLIFSIILLLATGLFVSYFVNDSIILSGLNQEKKLVEKTEEEVGEELELLTSMHKHLHTIEKDIEELKEGQRK